MRTRVEFTDDMVVELQPVTYHCDNCGVDHQDFEITMRQPNGSSVTLALDAQEAIHLATFIMRAATDHHPQLVAQAIDNFEGYENGGRPK